MSTTTKKFTFNTNVGGGVEVTKGIINIYQIKGEKPNPLLMDKEISSPNFDLDLSVDDNYYYYVTLIIKSYKIGNQNYETNYQEKNGTFITLLSVFGANETKVNIGSQSTIAGAFTFNQIIGMTSEGEILISETAGTAISFGMKNNFVHTDGAVSPIIASSPNGLETNSYPMFNYLSSILCYCLTDHGVYAAFTSCTESDQFIIGLIKLIRNPFNNVKEIYDLISNKPEIFSPSLSTLTLPSNKSKIPNQWTLTIKANRTGAENFLFAGTAFVVFDKDNKAWITNNFRAGTGNSGSHCAVLNADASPADFSPLTGGGLLGAAFGAAVNPAGTTVAIGNFGWGPKEYNPQYGGISVFSHDTGAPQCPPNGYVNRLSRVQGMCYDKEGNLWMASMGTQKPLAPDTPDPVFDFHDKNSAIVVYRKGNPDDVAYFDNFLGQPDPLHQTFDVVIDSQGYAYVSNMGDKYGPVSSVYKMQLTDTGLVAVAHWESDRYESLRQVAVDSNDNPYVGAIATNRIIRFDKELNELTPSFTTDINGPWGVNIDGNDTIFAASFAQEKGRQSDGSLDMHGPFGVTVIKRRESNETTFMTLPTGGGQIMLANGEPLYGTRYVTDPNTGDTKPVEMPCYEPLMRLTATGTDRAGNLWCMNNWKPSAYTDVHSDPGGDGVVIFIGVAEPAL